MCVPGDADWGSLWGQCPALALLLPCLGNTCLCFSLPMGGEWQSQAVLGLLSLQAAFV